MSKRRNFREDEFSLRDIFKSVKEAVLGPEEDFEDDVEEVEEVQEPKATQKSPKPVQESAPEVVSAPAQAQSPVKESAPTPAQKSVSESASAPVQNPVSETAPAQQSGKTAEAVIWRTLQADLNRFVQEGKVSESLLQLLEEGFEKNPQLLLQIAELVESRKVEERVHPGYLLEYEGKQLMISSKERAFELFVQRPGSTLKETIFVSKIVNGKAMEPREATEEESKLYFEQQSSKADASDQNQ